MSLSVISDEYWSNRQEPAVRAMITENYLQLVEIYAARVKRTLPKFIPADELYSLGCFGLLEAIDRFEPERGLKFETFASQRIRGSIIDGLRSQDWVPRSVRTKQKNVQAASDRVQLEKRRTPSFKEVANEAGLSEKELAKVKSLEEISKVIFADLTIENEDGDGATDVAYAVRPDPGSLLDFEDLRERIVNSILSLPDNQQTILRLYYIEGLSLIKISKSFDLTQSRVSQLYTKAINSIYSDLSQ